MEAIVPYEEYCISVLEPAQQMTLNVLVSYMTWLEKILCSKKLSFDILKCCISGTIRLEKVTYEFVKRMDPDLPFDYHTTIQYQIYEGEMPDFNIKPMKTPQHRRTPTYELLGADGSLTFAVHNSESICAMLHNAPVEFLPPP